MLKVCCFYKLVAVSRKDVLLCGQRPRGKPWLSALVASARSQSMVQKRIARLAKAGEEIGLLSIPTVPPASKSIKL